MKLYVNEPESPGMHSSNYVPCWNVVDRIHRRAERGGPEAVSDILGLVHTQDMARTRFERYGSLGRGAAIIAALSLAPTRFLPNIPLFLYFAFCALLVALSCFVLLFRWKELAAEYARETNEIYVAAEQALRILFLRKEYPRHLYLDDLRALDELAKRHPWFREVIEDIRSNQNFRPDETRPEGSR